MTYSVQITSAAQRQIRTLDPQVAKRVRIFLEGTLRGIDNPRSLGKPLIDRELWRYPVGDYRILVHSEDDRLVVLVLVLAIAHRREVYRASSPKKCAEGGT